MGADGEPWVWVMGEHEDDKTIEQILEDEAREAARLQAQKETLQIRISVEAEWDKYLEENRKNIEKMEIGQSSQPEDIYCSADELKQMVALPNNIPHPKRDALQEISFNKPHNVLQRVAQWEKRVMEEKTSEIFKRIQKRKQEAVKEAEEAESKQEQLWREQHKKAKEAELQIREIARRAREEHRRSVQDMNLPPKPNGTIHKAEPNFGGSKPPSKDAIVEWFRTSQIGRRAGLEPNSNVIAPWFHGLITRHEAEALLNNQPVGSFLVRLSERIWGYAISYRDIDRCKHYLVDASNGHYQFLGTNQISHNTLGDLINYHGAKPITAVGGELLGHPCNRSEPLPALFQSLFIRAR
ncbi:hypothetical protein AAG570_002370 [Ranatra chinensis]|uniref:SH2 domain-containing protein n=1 Tax=Ranatra chinensis TaxID=642074 RepID=A0ABD0YVQ7_9HEMI